MPDTKLCTCGSGLAYLSCCGAKSGEDDTVRQHRLAAYTGERGQKREEFCRTYISHKQEVLSEVSAELRKEADKAISCHKGCTVCCHVYVVASLQECEAIVYYLYQNADALEHFLTAFPSWRDGVEQMRDTFFAISRLQQKRLSHKDTPRDDQRFDAALAKYAKRNLPCPFLKDDACTIYEVRPYVCAGLVATTPAEWCASRHHDHCRVKLIKASVDLGGDPPYFANPESQVAVTNMPALVNELLHYGWDFLCRVPGCEHLTDTTRISAQGNSYHNKP